MNPSPLFGPTPRIVPLGVFVARRRKFFFMTPGNRDVRKAEALAFEELPLRDFGWTFAGSRIDLAPSPDGCTWSLER